MATDTMRDTATRSFEARGTGQGWAGCPRFCHPDATFSAQAASLEGVDTLEGYTDWMKGLYGPMPDRQVGGCGLGVRHGVRPRPDPSHDQDLD